MQTLTIFCGLCCILVSCPSIRGNEDKTPAEASPLIALLKAAKASDINSFKDAYSKRIREDKGQGDWDKNLKEAQGSLKKMFGDYDLKDFSFTFTGDKEKGKVALSHKGKESITLKVIKEGGEWKLDER